MSFLFTKGKAKTPQEIANAINDCCIGIQSETTPSIEKRKALEDLAQLLEQARRIIQGDGNVDADPDQMAALAKEIYVLNLLMNLLPIIDELDFNSAKCVVAVFKFLVKRQGPTVDYFRTRREIFDILLEKSSRPIIHRNVCNMIRECAKVEEIAAIIFANPQFWVLFDNCRELPFEAAADSLGTLSELVRTPQDVAAKFLAANVDKFSHNMNTLFLDRNYVTKRQAIKIQGQIIRSRTNATYMHHYVGDVENLKVVMRLLKDNSKQIHLDAFHLFKVFAANPYKPKSIQTVLARNKQKLLAVLEQFKQPNSSDRQSEKVFNDERRFVIEKIKALPDIPNSAPPSPVKSSQEHSPTRGPTYQFPSGPPSPSRAQLPRGMNLDQAIPVLSQVPHLKDRGQ